jgi:hypothetical protein
MSVKQMKAHKCLMRCHGCKNYITDENGVFVCSKFNKPFAEVNDSECALDGSCKE